MQLLLENKQTHLESTATGTMRNDDIPEYATRIIDEMRRHGLTKVLLEERDLIQCVEMFDVYKIAESDGIANAVMDGFRAACVPNQKNKTIAKTFETTFRNRSLNFKVFDDTETALAWLLA